MERIKINGKPYILFGKIRGHQTNKFNRATKLAYRFEELDTKFRGIIERGIYSNTEHSRCALALLLMMHTGIRVGNEGSAEGYYTKPHPYQKDQTVRFAQTYGLTTLLREHVGYSLKKETVTFDFTGKKQVQNYFRLKDLLITEALKELHYFKASETYGINEKPLLNISGYMLTKFIKKYVGYGFSPKDFRCMKANLIASEYVMQNKKLLATIKTKKDFKVVMKKMYESVAEKLNNTPQVCKKSYVCSLLENHCIEQTLI